MCIRCVFVYLFFITINSLLMANSFDINFSHKSGYYTSPINLIIETNTSETDVYYSVNKPVTLSNRIIYESSLFIDATSIVNTMAILNGDTIYKSQAFLFLNDIKISNNFSTHITESKEYEKHIDSSFLSIPTVCLNTAEQFSITDTIGPTEVPSSIIFILPHHFTKSVSVNCGVQTWGGSPSNLKRSYRLEFKRQYGPSKFKFDLFNNQNKKNNFFKTATKFDNLLLRASSQDGLNAEYGSEAETQFIKNRFIYDAVLEMGLPAPHGLFTHVFINNKYAGVYHLMEAPDEYFCKTYFFNNHHKDSVEIKKNRGYSNQPINPTYYNTLLAYSNGLNIESNYNQLANFINIDAAASYITYHHFFNSFDWSDFQNTILAAVPYKADGKFECVPWDFDFSLGARGTFTNTYVYDKHGAVPENLVNSAEFKFLQGDKVVCYCTNGGVLTAENLKQLYANRAAEIKLALIAEAAKWGNVNFDGHNSNVDIANWEPNIHWQNQYELILNEYLTNRTNDFIEDYKELNRLEEILPVKVVYSNDGIQLINPNTYGKIFYTLDGTDPRKFGGVLNTNAFIYANETICIEKPSKLIARVYATTNIDVRWSNFCPKKLYPTQQYDQLVINEIHYKPLNNNNLLVNLKDYEFVELKNNTNKTIFLQDVEFSTGITYKFNKNDSLGANQLLVLASDSLSFKSKFGFDAYGIFKGNLNTSGELLTLKDPNNNIIDEVNFNTVDPWPILNDTIEKSIELLSPNLENALGENWKTSLHNFSPGFDNDFCTSNPLTLTTSITNLSCFNSNDGIAAVSISGGQKPYATLWSNNETTNIIGNLSEGSYNLVVQDAFYCSIKNVIKINNPADVEVSFADNFAFVTGGKQPYTYLWSNGEIGKKLKTDIEGDYKLVVTDFNGCTKEKMISITQKPNCSKNIKPETVIVHNLTTTSVMLFWNAIAEGSYTIKYRSEKDTEWQVYKTNRTLAVLYNLNSCTTYQYKITYKCNNGENGIESDTISFDTKGC